MRRGAVSGPAGAADGQVNDPGVRRSMYRQSTSRPQDPEAAWAEHEEQARRAMAGLDFPVYGTDPAPGEAPERAALAAYEVSGGRAEWVELRSGAWDSPHGPYVSVRTHRPDAELSCSPVELEEIVEDERDRVYEHLGLDEGDGPGRVRALRAWITVDGEPYAVQLHEDRRTPEHGDGTECLVWAARLRVGGLVLTVTGRGVPPGGVDLHRVDDLDRYVRGRTALTRLLHARRGVRDVPVEERELPPAVGLEAHVALVAHRIAEASALEAQLRARTASRLPRRLRGDTGAELWESAVRQQMRLATETREEADAALTSMVNQLTRLARSTDWLAGTPEGEAAVVESARYTVFASAVASLPAQQAWERLWAGGMPALQSGTDEAWLSAWEQWRIERSSS